MGKGGSPKVEVNFFYMSQHFGVCSGPVDALLEIKIKEKSAWTGEVATAQNLSISQRELFGGDKKEGGAIGDVYYLPGASDQVLPDVLAQRLGRANGADCPGFRGLTSLFFYRQQTTRGFYWSANSPYLPGVWAKVRRAPVGLDPDYALIYDGTRTPRAISFVIDLSTSMAGTRLATMKAALSEVLDLISSAAESGVEIDLHIHAFGQAAGGGITRRAIDAADVADIDAWLQATTATALDTDFRVGMLGARSFFGATDAAITERFLFFVTDGSPTTIGGDTPIEIAEGAAALLDDIEGFAPTESYGINIALADTTYTAYVDNTPADGVPVVDEDDPEGLKRAVLNALFPDFLNAAANPAHIVYECLTNTDWGMGSPAAAIDTDSFEAAMLTLFAEGFGLSMLWTRQAAIQDFVQEVLDHIQAVLFVDPATGLLTLKLIRGDYDEGTLPELTPDNADLANFGRKLWGDIVNEIVVTWTNPENEQEETITVQDDASIATQGGIVSDGRNYYGVRTASLAMDLAMRDLRSAGQPLATCEAEVDRTQWELRPASVVKLTWPEYGLSELVMRVTSVDYGRPGDPAIKLSLVEDVYGLDIGSYGEPPATEWEDPSAAPSALETVEILTLPYFFALDTTVAAFVGDPEYPEVLAGVLATTESDDTFGYELWDEIALPNGDLEWQSLGTNNIVGRGELTGALAAEATSEGVLFGDIVGQTVPTAGGFAIIGAAGEAGNEIAMIDADNGEIYGYDLVRGVLDTVPREWPAGTPVWFVDGETLFEDPLVRSAGETVSYKLLSRTSQGLLALGDASLESATLSERPWLPSRPANVMAHGEAWSSELAPVDARGRADPWVTVTWTNRNRLTEDSQVLAWTDATVTPETGQTTRIEVRDPDGNLLVTHDGLIGTSFDVPDSSMDYDDIVRLRVYADRSDADGDFASLQFFEHWVQVAGDNLLLSGDATDGDDLLLLSGDETGRVKISGA